MELVSVIIPLYNTINHIEATINSVINQTYSNLELIIVDDHSNDGSYELAKTFESDNIKVVKNNRSGACAARNYGFSLSKGEFIQFLDADDLLQQEKIERQVKMLNNSESDCLSSGIWGKFKISIDEVEWRNEKMNLNYEPAYKWLLDSWKGIGTGQTAIWLTPRILIERAGPWNENLKINQDGEFFSRILMQAKEVCFCNEAKVYYRSGNPNSISQNDKFSRQKAESLLLSFQLYRHHANEYKLIEKLKEGIAQNFLMFVYQFYGLFPDLTTIAESEFYDLGYDKMWPVGGEKFKKLASLIGFKAALKMRKHIGY